jgi:wobble nucleotide-excising tRNase
MGEVTCCLNGNEVRGQDFPAVTLQLRVFNRDFVNASVFPVDRGDVPPIFVVGTENVEHQREADRLKQERIGVQGRLDAAQQAKQRSERELDRFCQDQARTIKDALRSPGPNPYNNYDKSHFQARIRQMATDGDSALLRLDDTQRDDLRAEVVATPKPKVAELTYRMPDMSGLHKAAAQALSATVVSAAIESLKGDPPLAEWTRQGLGIHKDRHSTNCLFCEQPLPAGRVPELEAHFSAEYERFLSRLEAQIEAVESASAQAERVVLPNEAELYEGLRHAYGEVASGLRAALGIVRTFLGDLARVLAVKRAQPFDRLGLDVGVPVVTTESVNALNEVLRNHNQACDEFDARVAGARDRLALGIIAGVFDEHARLREALQAAEAPIVPAQQDIQRLTGEIERLERQIVEHRQPAEELNGDLHKYLGHGELQLAIRETGYSITRNGVPADRLSEGEMTAIALLYFLKSLEDRDFELRNGLVVLDDPVSSLDQNALFAAFGYIRAKTQASGQLIVSTHNFMFFRLVREWFKHLPAAERRRAKVFMLQCEHDGTRRSAKIQPIDQLLMMFESEYHYLFARIYRMATEPPAVTLEAYYSAPSIARRVVETFLAFRVPDRDGPNRLWSQMQTIPFDDARKSRIYRYLQTHAHRDAIGDADEDLTLLGESRAVLNDILAFMRLGDADHVSRMIAKVTTANMEGDT